jgi:hypothetical protein
MALFRKGFVTLALLAGSLLVIYAAVRTPANATHTGSFIRNTSSGFVVDVVGALQNNGQPVILFFTARWRKSVVRRPVRRREPFHVCGASFGKMPGRNWVFDARRCSDHPVGLPWRPKPSLGARHYG